MSNAPYNPQGFGPQYPPPSGGGGGCGKFMLGCGLIVTTVLLLIAAGLYLAWPGFVAFLVRTDLAEIREVVGKSNLDPPARDELVKDLEAVRLSLDERKNFEFFQWIDISRQIKGMFADGTIDPKEQATLKTEVGRMKKTQGIEAK